MAHAGKIFGIGFHKTGTSSLTTALRRLGYRTIHGDPRGSWHGASEGVALIAAIDAGDYHLPTFDLFDAFVDNPYFVIWRELAQMFPSARFIHTVRDERSWIRSCVRYYHGRRVRPMRKWMFGEHADPSASEQARLAWANAYRRHNAAVEAYFGKDDDRLLTMDITKGDGWEKLCPFLDAPRRDDRFPNANKSPHVGTTAAAPMTGDRG